MSTTIPYDPSLALGNIVPLDHLEVLKKISGLQTSIDSKSDKLNEEILLIRKLRMTEQELVNLGAQPSQELQNTLQTVVQGLQTSVDEYAKATADNLPKVMAERAKIPQVSASLESPIDYNRSTLKKMPISADSLTMDAQYFSFNKTGQSSDQAMAALKAFVSYSTQRLGSSMSAQATAAAEAQVSRQREYHDIEGTLVLTANCTHKEAAVFAPLIIDVDKAIRIWNKLVDDGTLQNGQVIMPRDPDALAALAAATAQAELNILSGATYGSSFVGMVHVLKESSTKTDQEMFSTAESLQAQMQAGRWLRQERGGFGMSGTFANSAKQLLSQQEISSHISLLVMGALPTIEANNVKLAVKQFTDFDPKAMMDELSTIQNATVDAQATMASEADNSLTGEQVLTIQASKIKSAISAVGEVDDGQNKILDVNSLMTAFTDYVAKVGAGEVGVPIEYYLKPITAPQLAEMCLEKYFPHLLP